MIKRTVFLLFLITTTSLAHASRGYLGQNPVNGIHVFEASSMCGPSSGSCLLIVFDGGAIGCSPISNSLAFSLNEPNLDLIKSLAIVSLTTKKKFRTYGTKDACNDAERLNANGAGIHD